MSSATIEQKRGTSLLAVNVQQLASLLVGAAIFVLFCTPSIKLFILSEAINLLPVVLLGGSLLLRLPKPVPVLRSAVVAMGLMLFTVLFAFGAYNSASLGITDVIKYSILCALCVAVPLLTDRKALATALIMIAVWGVLLAVLKFSYGITLSREKGQTYLTLGYSLGASSLIGLLAAATARSFIPRIAGLLCFLISTAACVTLLGRGPVLFPILIFFVYLIANTVFEISTRKLLFRALAAIALFVPAAYYFLSVLSTERVFQRLQLLADIANEPRVADTYIPILKAIADQPFGHGLEASKQLVGNYPHNIFLEMWVSGGPLGFIVFASISMLFLRHVPAAAVSGAEWTARMGFFLTLYYFAVWNISFTLSSAYALLPMMIYFAGHTRRELFGAIHLLFENREAWGNDAPNGLSSSFVTGKHHQPRASE